MSKRLLVLAGPDEGRGFPIVSGETLLLGRSRATESRLIDPHVSRVHCQVQLEGDTVVLTDFDSAGGTFVNGKKIMQRQDLKSGDLIRIGNTRLQLFDEAGAEAAPVPMAIPVMSAGTSWAKELIGKKMSNYKIESLLARGKSSYVFHARDTRQNVPVALKVLEPRLSKDKAIMQRFVKAMKTVMPLRHANLVTVHSAGKTGANCWIAMEYVAGESLAAVIGRIETAGMLDWRHVLRLAVYITRALEYAHGKKLTHLNITPQNILVGRNPADTKLADLMLAKAVEREPGHEFSRAEILGDLPYMAPEQTHGPKGVDARADIYGLGATIYAMLTGQPPFKGDTVTELVTKIRREQPVPLKTFFLGMPDKFEKIIEKMVAKHPDERYATAGELRKELESLAAEKGVAVSGDDDTEVLNAT
jgi:serine/threonine protein kinase